MEKGRDPVLNPVLYKPDKPTGSRFKVMNPTTIPRMYHSTAILLRDGRVLVGGSNPHIYYKFTGVLYPTELRLEAFSPEYLDSGFKNLRPTIISPTSQAKIGYGKDLTVRFSVTGTLDPDTVSVTMLAPSFTTHSLSMNQRLLVLGSGNVKNAEKSTFAIAVTTPASAILAPSGYYILLWFIKVFQ
ncbi:Aldehyde oxidase GLOX1 [Vitis vinifera]|uniref:Aldehyde oxidase GLOX1 n=1 Tax=Vitis vinifera TaxID=29760 RepID=A0A438K253_VITVI|nr:Aldehyde oxidase GLOX1 [Vitis vinifera]